jgi:hypothetical protein
VSGNDEHTVDPGNVVKRVKGALLSVGDPATLSKLAEKNPTRKLLVNFVSFSGPVLAGDRHTIGHDRNSSNPAIQGEATREGRRLN